jgi:hypothetical protein
MEGDMTGADFYSRPESNDMMKKYGDLKAELAIVYADWEQAVEKLS